MLSLSNISFAYGTNTVLRSVHLDLQQGGFYALLGNNGSGKSTLLNLMAGLWQPTKGSITLNNKPLHSFTPHELALQRSYMPQNLPSPQGFSALQTVLMARHPYHSTFAHTTPNDITIAQQAMEQTSTWHLRNRRLDQISGGERQRVFLARALAQTAPLLLLDEPLSNLDIAHQLQIMQLLSTLNNNHHLTIVVALHDLPLAYRFCPQTILLHNNTLHYHGPTTQGLTQETIKTCFNVTSKTTDNNLIICNPTE